MVTVVADTTSLGIHCVVSGGVEVPVFSVVEDHRFLSKRTKDKSLYEIVVFMHNKYRSDEERSSPSRVSC